jgi:hypothetical protein
VKNLGGAWRSRRVWLTSLLAALTIGPVLVGEAAHLLRYGHLGTGLHADAVYDANMNFGIPGVSGAYSVQLVNLTPIPIPVRACRRPSDTSFDPPLLYRFQIERWDLHRAEWVQVLALPAGECSPLPAVWSVLWPGVPVTAVEWEATAARAGLHMGDAVRFTVFRDFRAADRAVFQLNARSSEVVMTEECTDPGAAYRVAH